MGMLLGRGEAITTEAPLQVRAVALQSQYRLRTDETTLHRWSPRYLVPRTSPKWIRPTLDPSLPSATVYIAHSCRTCRVAWN
jgi:hypothetical protein